MVLGEMLQIARNDKGITLTLTEDGRRYVLAERRQGVSFGTIFTELMEPYTCNDSWAMVRPEDVGALTSNDHLLTYCPLQNDDGTYGYIGTVYAFDRYMITSEIEEIMHHGKCYLDAHDGPEPVAFSLAANGHYHGLPDLTVTAGGLDAAYDERDRLEEIGYTVTVTPLYAEEGVA